MPISYRTGDDTEHGGLDITISLTPEEARALGPTRELVEWMDSALWALGMLRTGHNSRAKGNPEPTREDWYVALNDIDHHLLSHLAGIRDAAVRAHAEAGGTVQELANAMDVKRSAAQYRREQIVHLPPKPAEEWARTAPEAGADADSAWDLDS